MSLDLKKDLNSATKRGTFLFIYFQNLSQFYPIFRDLVTEPALITICSSLLIDEKVARFCVKKFRLIRISFLIAKKLVENWNSWNTKFVQFISTSKKTNFYDKYIVRVCIYPRVPMSQSVYNFHYNNHRHFHRVYLKNQGCNLFHLKLKLLQLNYTL